MVDDGVGGEVMVLALKRLILGFRREKRHSIESKTKGSRGKNCAFVLTIGVTRCSAGEYPNAVIKPGFLDSLGQECNAVSLMKRGSNAIIGYQHRQCTQ